MIINPIIADIAPTMPSIAKDILQPSAEIMSPVKDDKAPPRYIPSE